MADPAPPRASVRKLLIVDVLIIYNLNTLPKRTYYCKIVAFMGGLLGYLHCCLRWRLRCVQYFKERLDLANLKAQANQL